MPNQNAARRRIVVDGSNIATEGRTLPSLAQLDEAIRTFLDEFPGFTTADVTVVVDASFGHRIDPSEVPAFEEAILHGEMVTPPAGAIGRGDGFILRIAEKSGALVLSNDSFQEFHAERPWLFDDGRLIGGKPVPGIGWVFTPRTPVRGPKSRAVTSRSRRDAKAAADPDGASTGPGTGDDRSTVAADGDAGRSASTGSTRAAKAAKEPKAKKAAKEPKPAKSAKSTKAAKETKAAKDTKPTRAAKAAKEPKPSKSTTSTKATKAGGSTKASKTSKHDDTDTDARPDLATKATRAARSTRAATAASGATPDDSRPATDGHAPGAEPPARSRRSPSADAPALNEPLTFLTFVADHPVGSTVEGTVVSFTSHGAHVDVGAMRCHVPLQGLGNPPPVKARDVLAKGDTREFVLVSLDAARRRAQLALPGIGA